MEELKADQAAVAQEEQGEPRYSIDPQWYHERGISLGHVVRQRRCLECRESGFTRGVKKRRRAASDATSVDVSWEQEMQVIGECCSLKEGYITPRTPLVEAAFRLLLAQGNQPLSVVELYEGIKERWAGLEYLRELDMPTLKRLLEHQGAYGIRPVASQREAVATGG